MTTTERRVLRGFALAYHFEDHVFDEEGNHICIRAAILLGPRMIQADKLPEELAEIRRAIEEEKNV